MLPEMMKCTYFIVDGPCGTDYVPAEFVRGTFPQVLNQSLVPEALQPFCENTECYSIEKKHGWCARLSMPGYMDSTSWVCFPTKRQALEYLLDTYGDSDDDWVADVEEELNRCK